MERWIVGKSSTYGIAPAVVLENPKYPHNVGAALRAASSFGIKQVWFTGNRVGIEVGEAKRVPREERMRGYADVQLIQYDYPLEQFRGYTVVGVELVPGAESMIDFQHTHNMVYVFGAEDGGLTKAIRGLCHRFVRIPTYHCLNLSTAVTVTLYDRALKTGIIPEGLKESRGTFFEEEL